MAIDPLAKVHFNENYMQAFKKGSKMSRTALMRQVSYIFIFYLYYLFRISDLVSYIITFYK